MARPNKHQASVIKKRNMAILAMDKRGYPLDYIASFYSLTKGRVVQIIGKKLTVNLNEHKS